MADLSIAEVIERLNLLRSAPSLGLAHGDDRGLFYAVHMLKRLETLENQHEDDQERIRRLDAEATRYNEELCDEINITNALRSQLETWIENADTVARRLEGLPDSGFYKGHAAAYRCVLATLRPSPSKTAKDIKLRIASIIWGGGDASKKADEVYDYLRGAGVIEEPE